MLSEATGLVINFSKSTVTPMHLPSGALQEIMDILQCKVGSFPQTYLGLPLFNIKLPLAAFAPLIARIDRYLASWQALLLSTAGRVILINLVLAGSLAMQWGQSAAAWDCGHHRRAPKGFPVDRVGKASGASYLVA